ncbi:MAG: JAB domain-containing protein, partial [Alphaproteobacteria bacterium]|nr:JAB domain-containing protein [Alphaproteobacteria bacterium]
VNESALYVRELLKRALELSSTNLVLIHNHPSGNVDPSLEDIQITYNLAKAAKPLKVQVYDHIITAHDRFFSFRKVGLLKGV